MPKIDTITKRRRTPAGEEYSYTYRVWVDKESGMFSVEVPNIFAKYVSDNSSHYEKHGKDYIFVLCSKSLDELYDKIGNLAKEYDKTDIKRELVIIYSYESDMKYYVDNGIVNTDTGTLYSSRSQRSFHSNMYTMQFFARCLIKTTYTNSKGDSRFEYKESRKVRQSFDKYIEEIKQENKLLSPIKTEYYDKLNGFNDSGISSILESKNYKEIPYSNEAAKFFYNLMVSLCTIDYKMNEFFKYDTELVLDTIKNNSMQLMLTVKE